jgi:hypothetical protein
MRLALIAELGKPKNTIVGVNDSVDQNFSRFSVSVEGELTSNSVNTSKS